MLRGEVAPKEEKLERARARTNCVMKRKDTAVAADGIPIGPFVGRHDELARLCEAIEAARRGRGERIWLVGSPGTGKSRLLEEIARYAAWRRVRVEWVPPGPVGEKTLREGAAPGGLWLFDPLGRRRVEAVDARLAGIASSGGLAVATSDSIRRCREACVPEPALLLLPRLSERELLRLLGSWVGPGGDREWQRRAVERAAGRPGRLRRAVAARLAESAGAVGCPNRRGSLHA